MWNWIVGNVNTLTETVHNQISTSEENIDPEAQSFPSKVSSLVKDDLTPEATQDVSNIQSDSSEHELDSTEPITKQKPLDPEKSPKVDKKDSSILMPNLKEATNSGLNAFTSGISNIFNDVTDVVKSSKLVSEFLSAEEQFQKKNEQTNSVQTNATAPWYGYNEAEEMKTQILEISSSHRNLLREPPPGSTLNYSLDSCFGQAMLMLSEDQRLEQARFSLVPQKISEENFWRNYFYRVHLVKQSIQLGTLKREEKDSDTEGRSNTTSSVATDEIEPDEFVSDALDIQSSCEHQLTQEELNQLKLTTSPKPNEESNVDDALAQELKDFNPDEVKDEDFDYADFENLLKDN
ncbi:hypothetical protein LOD99_4157 [Oopsacas minuta]|uniref:BSD domain-containing protein n=1 Tax=Oopsacas minuta TaxID=111878 RepID=A0AAV7JVT6_9METZ|nr:hypothetical protein LOD99_4157 [Oopsacas minuta]